MKNLYGLEVPECCHDAIRLVVEELIKACEKHPNWPDDKVHAVAIMIEEAGESMQAALEVHYAGKSLDHLRVELVQTGAMAVRALMNLR